MPKASLLKKDCNSDFDEAVDEIRRYVRRNATGDVEAAFTNATGYGLLIGAGESTFMLSPYRGDRPGSASLLQYSGLHSFEELKALNLPKPTPVIEDLIYEGETVLLAGRPKVGKSRLVHQMAFSIESGTPFLGMRVPLARRVLIVDLENKPWAVRERLSRMACSKPAPGLFIWSAASLSEDVINASMEGVARLNEIIGKARAEVLILDPWRLYLGKDENNAEEVVRGLRALGRLREQHPNLTVIIVHHVRKERFESPRKLLADPRLWVESVSGHYALISHVDACYGLERQREDDGEEWITFGGIARNTEPRTVLLEDEEETLRFEVCQRESALEAVLTSVEKGIWKAAKKARTFGFTQLLKGAQTTNRKAATSMLRKAESHGLVTRQGSQYALVTPDG